LSLPAAPAKVLRTHHAIQAAEALALGPAWLDSGLVFTSTVGTVIVRVKNVLRRDMAVVRRQEGVRRLSPTAASGFL
jgi:hypothetical protein